MTYEKNMRNYRIMIDYGKTKKIPDENQCFNWIKSIHVCRLVNIGWLADINLFDSMI